MAIPLTPKHQILLCELNLREKIFGSTKTSSTMPFLLLLSYSYHQTLLNISSLSSDQYNTQLQHSHPALFHKFPNHRVAGQLVTGLKNLIPDLLSMAFNNDLGTLINLKSSDGSYFFVESRFIEPLPLRVVS